MDIDTLIPAPPPGALFVLPEQALYRPEFLALPVPQNPTAAVRLLIARNRYPLPLIKLCNRNMVRTSSIFALADASQPQAIRDKDKLELDADILSLPRRRGAPTMAERKARRERREIALIALKMAESGEAGHD